LTVARRRLRDERGMSLPEVERRIASLERTKEYVALALLGDEKRHARDAVERTRAGGWKLLESLNSGAHTALPTVDDRKALVSRTSSLARAILRSSGAAGDGVPTPVNGGGGR